MLGMYTTLVYMHPAHLRVHRQPLLLMPAVCTPSMPGTAAPR